MTLLQQGVALQRQGDFLAAEHCYQLVLQQKPDFPEANNLMGTIALEACDNAAAVAYFELAVRALPKDPTIRHNLGSALSRVHDYHTAVTQLRKALELKPGQVDSLGILANCLIRIGKGEDALAIAEKGLRMNASHPECRVVRAEALINLGRMSDAQAQLKANIADGIAVAKSWQSYAATQKFESEAVELDAVEAAIAANAVDKMQMPNLHFAAAKMCQDAKLYERAMEHYGLAQADQSKRFDIGAYERRIDSLINFFNPMFLGARKDFGDPSQKPVFILGMPRSGTTLTEQILSSHPQVVGAGELTEMARIARGAGDTVRTMARYGLLLSTLGKDESRALAERYLKFIRHFSVDAPRITDKMPHNFEQIGLISLLLPNATIIHCQRDAIDNCLSIYMNALNDAHLYGTDLALLGRYYRAYDRLMKHWHKVLPGRIFDNSYEVLVDDLEGQSRKMVAHCKLEWDDACLNYTDNARSITTISRWQARQPIYKTSLKRWKPYEKHLGPLINALGDLADTS
ncbi:MAG: sulfotransferase [Alphaproteobacteria bacterium]|nr:sulfotransferase [Alphaproteobacteria bacterium]